jgi:hypothetical protein
MKSRVARKVTDRLGQRQAILNAQRTGIVMAMRVFPTLNLRRDADYLGAAGSPAPKASHDVSRNHS